MDKNKKIMPIQSGASTFLEKIEPGNPNFQAEGDSQGTGWHGKATYRLTYDNRTLAEGHMLRAPRALPNVVCVSNEQRQGVYIAQIQDILFLVSSDKKHAAVVTPQMLMELIS